MRNINIFAMFWYTTFNVKKILEIFDKIDHLQELKNKQPTLTKNAVQVDFFNVGILLRRRLWWYFIENRKNKAKFAS